MRLKMLTLLGVFVSCSKPPPVPVVTVLAGDHETFGWIDSACDHEVSSASDLDDYTLPLGMETVHVTWCGRMLTNIVDVRIETQGGAGPYGVCALRIGPSPALATIDATSVESLFADKQLGARVRAMIEPGPAGADYERFGMVDGLRVAVRQRQTPRTSLFYLVIDGCGHVPDSRPGMSGIH